MLRVFLYGIVAGVIGTGLGGVFCAVLGKRSNRFMSLAMSLAGGIMVSIVCFDLIPEAMGLSSLPLVAVSVLFGAMTVLLLNDMIDTIQFKGEQRAGGERRLFRAGMTMFAAIALHNFPEGLAIGSGEVIEKGLAMALLLSLHNIPEGIAIGLPLKMSGVKNVKIIGLTMLSGLPTAAGAMVGYLIGLSSPYLIATCLAVAGGAMLFVSFSEMIVESNKLYRGNAPSVFAVVGILAGVAMMTLAL